MVYSLPVFKSQLLGPNLDLPDLWEMRPWNRHLTTASVMLCVHLTVSCPRPTVMPNRGVGRTAILEAPAPPFLALSWDPLSFPPVKWAEAREALRAEAYGRLSGGPPRGLHTCLLPRLLPASIRYAPSGRKPLAALSFQAAVASKLAADGP